MKRLSALLAVALLASGCYQATIITGRPMGTETIEVPWAHSFLAGLVPPSTLNTASRCPNGVAEVQTVHSFLNLVAAAVTFSVYTPMTLKVTCAAGGGVGQGVDVIEDRQGLERALQSGEPFYLQVPLDQAP